MTVGEINNQINILFTNTENLVQSIIGKKLYGDVKSFAACHPFIFTAIFAVGIFSSVPLLFFLGFVVITLFIAFICFLCIEGSLIAIGGLIFIGVTSFIAAIVVSILSAVASAYWIIQKIRYVSKSVRCQVMSAPQSPDSSEVPGDINDNKNL
ncbi:lipid droplet assembly factor 1-like isoform X2 [Stegodyphus dumicola]|nr:lipid droplet assembly factor 1-like isoform X2 [Stegodyphus dumicola]